MALIKCTSCGHNISEFAKNCPKCKAAVIPVIANEKIEPEEASVKSKPAASASVKSTKKSNRLIFWLTLGAAAIITAIILAVNLNPSSTVYRNSDGPGSSNQFDDPVDREEPFGDEENYQNDQQPNEPPKHDIVDTKLKAMYRTNINAYAIVRTNDYKQKLLGGIKNLQVTLTNNMEFNIASAVVQVDYYKMNDKLYTTKYVNFGAVRANSYVTMRAPETNSGTYVRCSLKSVNAPELN